MSELPIATTTSLTKLCILIKLPSFLFSRCGAVLPSAVPSVPGHPLRGIRSFVCSMAPKKPDVIPEVSLETNETTVLSCQRQALLASARCTLAVCAVHAVLTII